MKKKKDNLVYGCLDCGFETETIVCQHCGSETVLLFNSIKGIDEISIEYEYTCAKCRRVAQDIMECPYCGSTSFVLGKIEEAENGKERL